MGYPMTWPRVVNRNYLAGNYAEAFNDFGTAIADGERATVLRMIAGDLRRLEADQRDERHIARYADDAGISMKQARRVLDSFFTDFGLSPSDRGPSWPGVDPKPENVP